MCSVLGQRQDVGTTQIEETWPMSVPLPLRTFPSDVDEVLFLHVKTAAIVPHAYTTIPTDP